MKNLVANIVLSDDCNMRCKYCTFSKGKYGQKLDLNTHLATLEWINKNYSGYKVQINFSYGEPLTEFDTLTKLIEKALSYKETKFYFRFFTNGVLLNEDKIKFLRNHRDRIEMILSADGDEYGNRFRADTNGKPFGVNIQNLVDNNRDIIRQISVTIFPENVNEFYQNVLYTLDVYGIRKILFSLCVDYDWSDENINDFERQFDKVRKEYIKRYNTEEAFTTPANIFEGADLESRDLLYFDKAGDIFSCILASKHNKKMGNVFSGTIDKENYLQCKLRADCRLCFIDKPYKNTQKILDTFANGKIKLFNFLDTYKALKTNVLYEGIDDTILKNIADYGIAWDGVEPIRAIQKYLSSIVATQNKILTNI